MSLSLGETAMLLISLSCALHVRLALSCTGAAGALRDDSSEVGMCQRLSVRSSLPLSANDDRRAMAHEPTAPVWPTPTPTHCASPPSSIGAKFHRRTVRSLEVVTKRVPLESTSSESTISPCPSNTCEQLNVLASKILT